MRLDRFLNQFSSMKRQHKKKKTLKVLLIFLLLIVVACFGFMFSRGWIHGEFKASAGALNIITDEHVSYNIERLENNSLAFVPNEANVGVILYPGGLVQHEAYAPLMNKLAERGILCVMIDAKSGLPLMETAKADVIVESFPQIERWYIGGHSMGGLAAASYVSNHLDVFDGLILLAAYSNQDLSNADIDVLCIYGSEDGVMNRESYEAGKDKIPADFKEFVIEGGCHSYFADYGLKGEETVPAVSSLEQAQITAGLIEDFVKR